MSPRGAAVSARRTMKLDSGTFRIRDEPTLTTPPLPD
jgi:hypothetical protein